MINADINGHVGKIMSNAQTMPSPRIKSLFAIVSGVGRGKTRTLVEIMRTININHPETLCLAVTFNNRWTKIIAINGTTQWPTLAPETIYAFNIVARIISMAYRLSFE